MVSSHNILLSNPAVGFSGCQSEQQLVSLAHHILSSRTATNLSRCSISPLSSAYLGLGGSGSRLFQTSFFPAHPGGSQSVARLDIESLQRVLGLPQCLFLVRAPKNLQSEMSRRCLHQTPKPPQLPSFNKETLLYCTRPPQPILSLQLIPAIPPNKIHFVHFCNLILVTTQSSQVRTGTWTGKLSALLSGSAPSSP